jgi:hypothetical protein
MEEEREGTTDSRARKPRAYADERGWGKNDKKDKKPGGKQVKGKREKMMSEWTKVVKLEMERETWKSFGIQATR